MRRWLKIVLAIPLLLLVLAAAAWGTLLHTTFGAGLVLDVAKPRIPGRLEYASLQGSIADGLEFTDLAYEHDSASVAAGRARLAVVPGFRPFILQVRYLEIEGLRYVVHDTGAEDSGPLPESLALPFRIELDRLQIDGMEVIGADGEPLFVADRLGAALAVQDRLDLRDAVLESPLGRLAGSGQLLMGQPYAVDLEADAQLTVDPGEPHSPLRAEGRLRLVGSVGSYVVDFDGTAVSADFDLDAVGRLDLEAGTVDGRLEWTDFSWPLGAAEPRLYSRTGSVTAAGRLDDWAVRGQAEVESPGYPEGTLAFDATGNRERLRAEIIEGRFLGGTLAGRTDFSWVGDRPFETTLKVENVSTGPLYPEIPGVVSGDFTATGQLEPLFVTADIGQLEGEVRGHALSASGRASYRPGELGFRTFEVQAGTSRVSLDGSLDRPDGLRFDADVRDLGLFVAEAAGRFEASGGLAIRNGRPRLELELQGQDLSWRDLRLPEVVVRNRASGGPDSLASLSVEARAPTMGQRTFDELLLEIEFGEARQDLEVTVRNAGNNASATLSGQVADLDAPLAAWRWTGQLNGLAIEMEEESLVRLERPAGLELEAARLRLDRACMTAGKDSRICLEGGWTRESGVVARLALEEAPLMLLTPLLGQEVEFTQHAQGELQFEMDSSGEYSGVADIRLSPGVLRLTDDPDPILQTGPGVVGFRLVNGGLEAGNLVIPLPGQGDIDLDFSVPDLDAGMDSEIEGRLRVALNDLDVLSTFLPIADEISGRLEADLQISGTAERPRSKGHLALSDGVIANRTSGLRLSEIQLSGQMEGNGRTEMQGSFRAAEGIGSLDATIDLTDVLSPRIGLGIRGSGLKLFDSQDLSVVAEPDMRLEWEPGGLHVDGSITIPSARVAPTLIPAGVVSQSEDVHIVAGELPATDAKRDNGNRIAVFGKLDVVLGERVLVDLDVADVNVSGKVRFDWQGDLIPMANGSFDTSGEILTFGQLLEIAEGKVLFPNVPASEPHLNIKAERQIYGNSEIRRAGMLITGTLRRPVMEPYTIPMTNRERAQTLLITGSDFNMERGVGAVSIGTYIAPRVFVSYGIGVFENDNVFSIRYDLGRGWGVKATSGERQTGVDISYTVDQ